MTPKQYIVSIRMTNAQMLLESSDYTVQQIASFVGYEDALYFGRVFKRGMGMTPSQHWKQFQQAQRAPAEAEPPTETPR